MAEQDLLQEIKRVEDKLDKHISIYRENGEAVRENNRLIIELQEDLEPFIELQKAAIIGRKAVLWFTSLIIAIGGAVLTIKGIFK